MKKLGILLVSFSFLSCQTPIKTQRPELSTPKQTVGPKLPPGKSEPNQTSVPAQPPGGPATGGLKSPVEVAGSSAELLSLEQKFLVSEKTDSYGVTFMLASQLALNHPDPKQSELYKAKAIELINYKLAPQEVHEVARSSDHGFLRGYALFKLADIEVKNGQLDEGKRYYRSVIEFLPESDVAISSQKILSEMEATTRVSPQTIGVVVPLSGKSASIGQKVLRGLQLGLGTHQSFSKFRLAVIDSEGRSDVARQGIERLVKEDNVIAIVGGVLSKTVTSELTTAQEFGVPFIYLSQKQGLGDIHNFAIRNALTAEMQVRHLVRAARTEMDIDNFAILYPNDAYGVEYANVFWDEVLAQGGQVVAAQAYDPKETDFRSVIQRLVGTYYIEARKDEYYKKLQAFKQTLKGKNTRETVNTDDILPPIQNFEAIFIPDQAKVIAQINAFLNYSRVKETKILSTNILNTPGSSKRLAQLNYPVYFSDSFISEGPQQSISDFVREYVNLFNEYPAQFEIAAYDSGLVLRQLILQGASSRDEIGRDLIKLKNFAGSFGPLTITNQKDLLRPLMTLTVDKGEISTLQK